MSWSWSVGSDLLGSGRSCGLCLGCSGEAVPGVALPGESSGWAAWSSSSGMCRESLGRWPLFPVVEPGVVVVMGGGDAEMTVETRGVGLLFGVALESTL